MRMTQLLFRTLKEIGGEAELPSHQLTVRAGLARRIAAGVYSLTPLAYRVIKRIEQIIREEMDRIGGQEVLLPVVAPAELWQESGRYEAIDTSLARWKDRTGHPMVLAMTHEEAVTDLVRSLVDSYRQLPLMVYQVQTKFRDEARPRAGLIRLREFLMKDAYSFHTSHEDLDRYYDRVVEAYKEIFRRIGIPVLVVESDSGMMGGRTAHEFMLLADGGEDTLMVCPGCGYAANQEVAVAAKGVAEAAEPQPLAEVHTPGTTSIAALAAFLGVPETQTLKAVFYAAGDDLVVVGIRGDLEVSEVKLRNLLGAEIRSISAEEATAAGLTVGYCGPVGLTTTKPVRVVMDDSVVGASNLVAGANKPGYHLTGVTYGRDYAAELTGDIAVAAPGHACARCGTPLTARRGIEVGNTFKLGTKYSAAMNARYRDEGGLDHPMIMGCYGIGITRLLASVIEEHHDADGIKWPAAVAPYPIHLLVAGKDEEAVRTADTLYAALGEGQVLYDDRDLSAGVKFKDADLLGMPVRVTVSQRSLKNGGVEMRVRATGETQIVPLDQVPAAVRR
ncbi:MAG TPA: proline--tRNA ligase [Symbiobacteriaceae bacterium]|jgi:prolyl-tRNA synthetase|nr:proline--tRNA ligase [Symbiobacteriaceae bacterium]